MNSTLKSQQNPLSNTLYNLQSKRTLPRDVIKWMQGLDLSYSVKDYRKDLSNGFLIAQIISRYEPGKIPMHAFQNSHNQARVENNWGQLGLFFSKNQLRRVKVEQSEFAKIKMGNDSKSEQLYEFICRLYTVCTKRNLPEGNQMAEIPMNQTRNPNLTASYLLKDDGLQKLQNSQISQISHPQPQKSHEDRVPTRKISPQLDAPARVDVKGIGIKQQTNRKMTSKKKSWQAKSESFYEESNPYVEKYVFDYLNQILQECLNNEQAISSETRDSFKNSQSKFTQTFVKGMPWESKLFLDFLSSVKSSVNEILSVMLKDLNEIWKFFNYFVQFVGYFAQNSEQFDLVLDVLITYANGGNLIQKRKINKVFLESIIDSLISEVKGSTEWKKRGRIMEIVYDFSGREIEDKKAVLFTLKEKLGSSNPLYFGWLTELVKEEKNNGGDSKLIQDFIYYANQQISSSNPNLRISSLKILYTVASNGWISLIESFLSQEANLRKFKYVSDFEAIYLISSIYLILLKQIVENNEYQSLAKGKNQGNSNALKVYNPDHQKQANEIKQKVHNISMVIAQLYHNSSSYVCRQVIAKQSVSLMGESVPLLLVVVFHLSSLKELSSFLSQESFLLELKTTQALVEPIKTQVLQENVNEMMGELIRLREEKRSPSIPQNADLTLEINQQLALMNFCLKHINIKKLNIELWQNIGDRFCKQIAGILCDSQFSSVAWEILQKIYAIIFNYDMKMPNLNIWVAESICQGLRTQGESFDMAPRICSFFKQEYENANMEEVKSSADQINEILEQNGFNRLVIVQRS